MRKVVFLLAVIVSAVSNAQENRTVSTNRKVDLGLSVYWSGYNLGTSSPENCGYYISWGESEHKELYDETNCIYNNRNIGSDISGTRYDAASTLWGGSWRMPTWNEWQELIDECSWVWTTYKAVNGYIVTGPNGNSIFLPANGYAMGNGIEFKGERGCYNSSIANGTNRSCNISFSESGQFQDDYKRQYGLGIRPVCNK